MRRLDRLGVDRDDVLLVALDPDSFGDFPHRVRVGARGRGLGLELVPAGASAAALIASGASGRAIGSASRELAACDAIVGVGGGYLRAADAVSSLGTLLNHLPQLLVASRAGVPSLYMPQTIGPLRGPVGRAVSRAVAQLDAVCLRDPWSRRELAGHSNVRQVPDLVVLEIAGRWAEIRRAGGDGLVGIVAGQLPRFPGYERGLVEAARGIGWRAAWLIHKTGHRTKSDATQFERLGIVPAGTLSQMLQQERLSVMVSVRLHAALMSIAAGVPAIHLAYDRKGPGAFGDLGLERWCFDLRSLDPAELVASIDELARDPSPYWGRIEARVPALQASSAELDEIVDHALG